MSTPWPYAVVGTAIKPIAVTVVSVARILGLSSRDCEANLLQPGEQPAEDAREGLLSHRVGAVARREDRDGEASLALLSSAT